MAGIVQLVMVLGVVLIFFTFIFSIIVIFVKLLKGGGSKNVQNNANESRMIQEIYQGLARMEERVESLETILMERERARKERGENGRL